MQIASIESESEESSEDEVVPQQPRKRVRQIATTGSWLLCLILVGSGGFSVTPVPGTFEVDVARSLPTKHVCGVLLTRWEFLHTLPKSES